MTCDQLEIWISTYQDGELDPRRRRLVEEHLAGCPACRALGEEMVALTTTLRAGLERWDPPDTLHTRVMHQIPQPKPAAAPGSRTPRGWLSFGLVPVGLLAAWLLAVRPPVATPPPVNPTPLPTRIVSDPSSPSGQRSGSASMGPQLSEYPGAGATRPAAQRGHGAVEGGSGERAGKSVRPGASTGSPKGARSGGVRRAPRTESELEPLRRLQQHRPPRWQRWMVTGPRRRPRPQIALRPDLVLPGQSGRKQPSPARITVVEYVLPEVPAPAAEPGNRPRTEFVLRAADSYHVSDASFEY